ncbi:MAG TPA: hypothetical protein VF975_04105 [Thermoanaerobaculia bacterium]
MNCPKCGAAQDAGGEECSACGIVFARWQPREFKRPPTSTTTPVERSDRSGGIPTTFIIVGLVFVVILGLIWTRHIRSAREKANSVDLLNEINNAGEKTRRQLREEAAAIRQAQARAMTARAATTQMLPTDLDETAVRELIERCRYFQERVTVDVPKNFQTNLYSLMVDRYPALPAAVVEHFVELDPPFEIAGASRRLPNPAQPGDTINVKLAPLTIAKVDVSDSTDTYHFGLGRRRIDAITGMQMMSESSVSVSFNWKYDQNAGASLSPEGDSRTGGARLQRVSSGWVVTQAWRNTHSTAQGICQ